MFCLAVGLIAASVHADDTQAKAAPKGTSKSQDADKNKGADVGQLVRRGAAFPGRRWSGSRQVSRRTRRNLAILWVLLGYYLGPSAPGS